jgi:DNA-binding response OmpR family regulator
MGARRVKMAGEQSSKATFAHQVNDKVATMKDTVLIVDDSLTVRMDLQEGFEAAGFDVQVCATAAAALHALEQAPLDVVVLDVLLPDGDGVELLRVLRASPLQTGAVVLMLSTEAEVAHRIRGLRTGADEYVGKPYDRHALIARTHELLRHQVGGRELDRATVLVIDDSPTFREEMAEALMQDGYAVLQAESGEEGLRLAAAARPSAVIVDGVLPGIDGSTVIRRIRLDATLRGTPCLLLSAAEEAEAELRALDAGADAFVRKDETLNVILARLAAVRRSAASSGSETHPGRRRQPHLSQCAGRDAACRRLRRGVGAFGRRSAGDAGRTAGGLHLDGSDHARNGRPAGLPAHQGRDRLARHSSDTADRA